jgi:hypothetical protein
LTENRIENGIKITASLDKGFSKECFISLLKKLRPQELPKNYLFLRKHPFTKMDQNRRYGKMQSNQVKPDDEV